VEWPDPDAVTTLSDLVVYLERLAASFEQTPDEWQNHDIGSYLEGIAAWLRATPTLPDVQAERARELEQARPTWRGVANLFYVGSIYE